MLACEGRCNPNLSTWDLQATFGFHPDGQLTHTIHVPTGRFEYFKCDVCGHIRFWGANAPLRPLAVEFRRPIETDLAEWR